jgi:hypothetical protein
MARVNSTLTADLKKYGDETNKKVRRSIADTAVAIEIEATRRAPAGQKGGNFINIDKKIFNKGYTAEIGVMGENKLAAYFEFGTGLSAAQILAPYPKWIKDIAKQFYVNGKGTLKGKPYLYPAVLRNFAIFEKELNKIING